MTVLSINRQFGAGGKTLGERLARKLDYFFVDHDLVDWVADEAGLSTEWVDSIEQGDPGKLTQVLSKMVISDFIERRLEDSCLTFDQDKYIPFVKKVITDVARNDHCVILGRGSCFILPDEPRNIKILLSAGMDYRIRFLRHKYDLTEEQAKHVIKSEEKARNEFLAELDERNPMDPNLYHLCINTGLVGLDKAEKMILDLMEATG